MQAAIYIMLLNTRNTLYLWFMAHTTPQVRQPNTKIRAKSQRRLRIPKIQRAYPDAPKPIHFNKEQFRPPTRRPKNKHPNLNTADLFRNGVAEIRNSEFPCKYAQPTQPNSWWRWTESNRRPSACKADALPIELHPHLDRNSPNMVGQGGLEPPTPRLSSVCSNQLSY
jgi:hypothetical protein